MKNFTRYLIALLVLCFLPVDVSIGQVAGQVVLDPTFIPQFVDPLPHFAGLRVDAKAGGNLIIEAVKTQQVAVSTGTVLENGKVGTVDGAGLGNYFAYKISKDGGSDWYGPLWPAFTIEAQRGKPLKIEVRNELREKLEDGSFKDFSYLDVNIAADQTIMMNGVPLTGDPKTEPYTGPVPIAVHLHGGEVQSTSDGGPLAWFTPGYAGKGSAWGTGPGGVNEFLTYPNAQEAATLWYHEHSQLGLTRINVYAGMAGFYFLRGPDEEIRKLPGWSGDDLVQEVTPAGLTPDALHEGPYLPEIEIAIQDRKFDRYGRLYYDVSNVPNPDIHPFWNPEFFGDIITVNGKTWPYLSVAPRKYRFHLLDGSNARFYNLWLVKDLDTFEKGLPIVQIGTDGGLLDAPVVIDPAAGKSLLLGPGERADVIIDFSKVPVGTVLTLVNDAPAPYPDGDDVPDPAIEHSTGQIMQFIVNGLMVDNKNPTISGKDKSVLPKVLRTTPLVKLSNFAGQLNTKPDVIRQLTLNEVMGEGEDAGPLMVLLNNSRYQVLSGENMGDEFGLPTEIPVEGTTEKWQLINMTGDAHPMHMHLVQFQLVSRQDFDKDRYENDYTNSFTGVNGGMAGMYMGAEGPPFQYDKQNTDDALGGNLPITDYLIGNPRPPEPNERGWKDVIVTYPNQVTTYIVRFAPTDIPNGRPKPALKYPFDPSIGPGYVWHCHIVEHEDNDMMRPLNVLPNPSRPGSSSVLSTAATTLGDGVVLEQNNPNPFSTTTEIRFTIPNDGHVRLTLSNSIGLEFMTLVDEDLPAGSHSYVLSKGNLQKGIYFYNLNVNGQYTVTKTLVVN